MSNSLEIVNTILKKVNVIKLIIVKLALFRKVFAKTFAKVSYFNHKYFAKTYEGSNTLFDFN
jgi:hypothetical protein